MVNCYLRECMRKVHGVYRCNLQLPVEGRESGRCGNVRMLGEEFAFLLMVASAGGDRPSVPRHCKFSTGDGLVNRASKRARVYTTTCSSSARTGILGSLPTLSSDAVLRVPSRVAGPTGGASRAPHTEDLAARVGSNSGPRGASRQPCGAVAESRYRSSTRYRLGPTLSPSCRGVHQEPPRVLRLLPLPYLRTFHHGDRSLGQPAPGNAFFP